MRGAQLATRLYRLTPVEACPPVISGQADQLPALARVRAPARHPLVLPQLVDDAGRLPGHAAPETKAKDRLAGVE